MWTPGQAHGAKILVATAHRSREIESRLAVYEQVLSCRNLDHVEKTILAPMADYLEAETSCFLQFMPAANGLLRIGRSASHNVPANSHAQYVSHYFRIDPAIEPRSLELTEGARVFCTSDICDYSEFVRGEFYNEFFEPIRIHHVMVMLMRPDQHSSARIALGFHRPKKMSPFGDSQKRRAQHMASAACSALRGLLLQDDVEVRDETISRLEKAHPETGIVFFDEHLALLYGNPKGLRDMKLGAHADAPDALVKTRLAKVFSACRELQATQNPDRTIEIEISADEDVVATVQATRTPRSELLFSVHTSEPKAESRVQRRCANFGMTKREIDAVRLLRAGLSNGEIASRLFISPRTVENHLRSIYAKAGVNTRAQLLYRIMG